MFFAEIYKLKNFLENDEPFHTSGDLFQHLRPFCSRGREECLSTVTTTNYSVKLSTVHN